MILQTLVRIYSRRPFREFTLDRGAIRDNPDSYFLAVPQYFIVTWVLCASIVLVQSIVLADEPKHTNGDSTSVQMFLTLHCRECHTGEKLESPKGDFSLTDLNADFTDEANRQLWLTVAQQLLTGTMPPAEKPRPLTSDVSTVLDWIGGKLSTPVAGRAADQTRMRLRRLSRAEYVNTLRDLLKVDINLNDLLPPDTSVTGFDNSAQATHTSSYLLENYLKAADLALDAAIAAGPKPRTLSRRFDIKNERTVKSTGSVYRHIDDGVAIFSSWVSANIQVTLWQFQTRERGKYRFRISGYGYQTEKPVTFHVMVGPMNAAAQQTLIGYFDFPAKTPTVVEFTESLDPNQTIRIIADGLGAIPPEVERVGADKFEGPGLVVQWVDIDGPLIETWPPESRRALFSDLRTAAGKGFDRNERLEERRQDVDPQGIRTAAQQCLLDFARRAFRRPVAEADIKPFLARVNEKLDQQASFEAAVRVGLRSVLMSPQFLFLHEPTGRLDDYAMASRLSYFLWSSMPDRELFAIAERGSLREPEVLRGQVERMLNDPKAAAFTENFCGQWLALRAIDSTMPDAMLYPEYDDVLKVSSVKETFLFFDELLKNNLSLTNFVSSEFAMLNGRLAKHYGIPGVEGMAFRKVQLAPESRRGGVLTMASVLKVTANGTTTSPILRGAWVLDRILGTPPPKPRVDVEAVEPDIRGATTIREQLAKHRERSECASCHALIDPPGFALENFDVIGGWRDRYRSIGVGEPIVEQGRKRRYLAGPSVDSSDVLLDGRRFKDITEYKQLLLADKNQLTRALAEKLLTYALGSAPTLTDRPDIRSIVQRVSEKQYGFRTLIHEIVQSRIFLGK